MAHPQSSPRGLFAKERIDIGSQQLTFNSTSLNLSGGIKVNSSAGGLLTANASGLTIGGALTLGGTLIGSDATGAVLLETTSALPGNVTAGAAGILLVTNSTGTSLAINTTGTTWVYMGTTSVGAA